MAFIRIEIPNEILNHYAMAGGMVPRLTIVDDDMPVFVGLPKNSAETAFTDTIMRALINEFDGASVDLVKQYRAMTESGTMEDLTVFATMLSDIITTTVALGLTAANKHISMTKDVETELPVQPCPGCGKEH